MDSEVVSVACAIIIQEAKLLVAQRSQTMRLPKKWELPGGKIEIHELAEDCLKRELLEELNITVTINEFFASNYHEYDFGKIELRAYFANINFGTVEALEHLQLNWMSRDALKTLDWADADIPIIERLLQTSFI